MNYFFQTLVLPEISGSASFTAYLLDGNPVAEEPMRPAVIICPGGAYGKLSLKEAEPIAMQYLAAGYHAFILWYSLPPFRFPTALQELAFLVAHVREHAGEWHVDPEKIVVSGFSAGGHLACSLGAFWNQEFVYKPLGLTAEAICPNGMILCYPVVTSGEACHPGSFKNLLGDQADDEAARHQVSLEYQVGPHTPKTFLWHTVTDAAVPVANSMLLAEALLRNHVNLEYHLYPTGCHGLSLATKETSVGQARYIEPQCQSWIDLVKCWMEHL